MTLHPGSLFGGRSLLSNLSPRIACPEFRVEDASSSREELQEAIDLTATESTVFRDESLPDSPGSTGSTGSDPKFLRTMCVGEHETHGLRSFRGIVNMEGMMSLSPEAFEISVASDEVDIRNYAYKRSARRSVMLTLGVAPVNPRWKDTKATSRGIDIIDPYSKSSTYDCFLTYCAVMIGLSTFELTEAVAKCGYVPGVSGIVGFSMIHCFLCHRLVEVPQLTEQNLEYYTDIAKVCFNRAGWRVVTGLTICCWFAMCVITLQSTAEWSRKLFMAEMPLLWQLLTTCVVVMLALRSGAKGLHQAARYSLAAMVGAGIIECAFAVAYGVTHWHDLKHVLTGDVPGMLDGFTQMAWAFTGVGILPYVLAGMLNPVDAKQLTTRACQCMCAFYLAMSTVCYCGLGDAARGSLNTVDMLNQGGFIAKFLATLLSLFCIVKTLVSYKLFFWPFLQEVERFAAVNDAPAIALQVPWAIRRAYWQKSVTRLLLIFASVGPIFVDVSSVLAVLHVPVTAVHYFFPALFPVFACHIHRGLVHKRMSIRMSTRSSLRSPARDDLPYFCRHFPLHVATTYCVAVLLCFTTIYLTVKWLWVAGIGV